MIEIKELYYTYPNQSKGIDHLSVLIPKGTTLGIIGRNGSGKSTLIQCLAGILKPQHGTISVDGVDLEWKDIAQRSKILSSVLQFPQDQLFQSSIEKEIIFTLKQNHPHDWKQKLEDILDLCQLTHLRHLHPYEVSYSKQKLVLLACACARPQNIILMDEMSSGLDNLSQQVVGNVVEFLKNAGKTIIMVSHDINFVAEHCDQLMMIHENQCLYSGGIKDAMAQESLFNQVHIELPDIVKLCKALDLPYCTTRQEWIALWTKK
jgi:energy-coupling factor transport system ATP-binding protein